jgi:putative transposase
MAYDPARHQRRSIRLQGYDYSQEGIYFVTICTDQRRPVFADPATHAIASEQWRSLARAGARGQRGPRVRVDAWVVMPDHVHGIIVITAAVDDHPWDDAAVDDHPWDDADLAAPCHARHDPWPPVGAPQRPGASSGVTFDLGATAAPLHGVAVPHGPVAGGINVAPGSLGAIVRSYKATVARRVNHLRATPGATIWQRGYYERIVRDDGALAAIRRYIERHPGARPAAG